MSLLEVTETPRQGEPGPDEAEVAPPPPPSPEEGGPVGPRRRRLPPWTRQPESLITLAIVLIMCGFVFGQLQPSKLFLNTTPAGGDMGAHVWQPAFLRDHLLTHYRLTGWAPDWYAGFPSLVFYFPLPSLFIVLANVIVPYGVAFKLVSVLGLITLPLAAWAFGRLARFPFPGPACLAAATLPFLFSRNFTIYGGNIASTLAGEFGFSISLSAALIFLGLVARGLDTGKYRAWASVALVVTGLCHILPAIFAVVGAVVLTLLKWDRRRWLWMVPVFAVAAGLSAFWWLPFLLRLPYATDMGYEKITQYSKNLVPPFWLWALAGLGALLSVVRTFIRRHATAGLFLAIMAALAAVLFRFAPQARLWNARVLPFWFLCLYLLAGVAIAESGALIFEPFGPKSHARRLRWSLMGVAALAAVASVVWVSYPLHKLPFGKTDSKSGQYSWLGIRSTDRSFIPDWVNWNYSGYEAPSKARKAEYFGLLQTMTKLGHSEGCGRALWEYESELDQMGTPDALMLLPYWTNGCIGSMEGLYYESSATTPYHFLNAAELSLRPSNPVRGLRYPPSPDVATGVRHLQLMGVKYYMALTPETQAQADINPDLRLVATSGPWPVNYSSGSAPGVKQRTWKVYEVSGSELVTPLINQPVVMRDVAKGGQSWLNASQSWYLNRDLADVMYGASGPSNWQRVPAKSTTPPRVSVQPVQVANIHTSDNSVSFDVDTTGIPVLVKVSYFPSWQVSGGKGPYRVAPNFMVVIPTSHHVSLHYGYTPVDGVGYLLGLMGLMGLMFMVRSKPPVFAPPRVRPTSRLADAELLADPYIRLQQELSGAFPPLPPQPGPGGDVRQIDAWLGLPAAADAGRAETGPPAWGIYPPATTLGDVPPADGASRASAAQTQAAGRGRSRRRAAQTDPAAGDIGVNPPGWSDEGLGADGLGGRPTVAGPKQVEGPLGRPGRADPKADGTGGGGPGAAG